MFYTLSYLLPIFVYHYSVRCIHSLNQMRKYMIFLKTNKLVFVRVYVDHIEISKYIVKVDEF